MDLFQPFERIHEAADLLPGVGGTHGDAQAGGSPRHGGETDGRNEKIQAVIDSGIIPWNELLETSKYVIALSIDQLILVMFH